MLESKLIDDTERGPWYQTGKLVFHCTLFSRDRFINDFGAIQIPWTFHVAVIPLLIIRSQQNLHMARQHSCRAILKML